ncbi:MAG: phospholipid carrier-dependent glycosyltransferase [Planctomycetales bacterium]|nr:phospholipid carrier-dependent glycosyltransferase [Planctomycetales bacterium]
MSNWRELGKDQALLVLVALIVLFTNLGGPRLWDRDEPRNAGCAAEMQARGDWVVPVFNDQLRDAKPVLLYWCIMSAYQMFGIGEFAARFWSAVCGIGTVLATYHLGRRLFQRELALWAALILSTTLMFTVAARAATPDSLLIFFSTTSLLVYVLGTFAPRPAASPLAVLRKPGHYFPSDWRYLVGMNGLMGLGILAKGPVAWLLPTAVIGMFLLLVRLPARAVRAEPLATRRDRWRACWRAVRRPFAPLHFARTCWSMHLLTGLAVALAVCLPWFVLVGWRTEGAWLRGFFLEENLGRALRPMENHGGPPFYYLLALAIGFLPWSILLAPAFIGAVARIRRGEPSAVVYLFLCCWGGVTLGLFSLARTKLPSYITPSYPAFALLAAAFLDHWQRGKAVASTRWLRVGLTVLMVAGPVAAAGVFLAAARFLPGDQWLGGVFLILSLGAGLCLLLVNQGRRGAAATTLAATALLFHTTLFGFVSLRVDRHQQNHLLLRAIQRRGDAVPVGAYGSVEPSLVFYAGRPIVKLRRGGPAPGSHAARPRASTWTPAGRPREVVPLGSFLARDYDALIITNDRYYRQIQGELPGDVGVLARVPYFLKKHQLLLLGRPPLDRAAHSSPSTARR